MKRTTRGWPPLGGAGVFAIAVLGGACSAAWVLHASLPLVWQQARAFNLLLGLPAVGLTLVNLGLRFLRWQFLLRHVGVRLPTRQSAGIFTAGLAMLLTPAYAGEGVKTWLVARAQPGSAARAAGVVVTERLLDAVALGLIGGVALLAVRQPAAGVALLAAGLVAGSVVLGAGRFLPAVWRMVAAVRGGGPVNSVPVVARREVGLALLLSLAAWGAGCATLAVVSWGLGFPLGPARALGTYAASTLLGGLTLLPAGVGVVGTAILAALRGYGATEQQAVLAALLTRLFTVWLTAALGIAACWPLWRRARALDGGASHFDALAPRYGEQLSTTARGRVVSRKLAISLQAMQEAGIGPGARVLDAGCGPGWYLAPFRRAGYHVTGVDLAFGQLQAAREEAGNEVTASLVSASLFALPAQDGAFDAAYAVNVLHHVGVREAQERALSELARVVRPGGVILVHEISTINPLYRLYMAYLFPLWKQIDLGTETWLDPRRPLRAPAARLSAVHQYTFLPDFTPSALYRWLAPFEKRLESTPWARYAAHFTLVYRRETGTAAAAADRTAVTLRDSAALVA